jgi:hypothetical protein
MKLLAITLPLFALALPLRADNWVANGDFANGISHWYGNGRAPADMASDNPFDKPNPQLAKGLIIPLKKMEWTKVAQDFKGKGTAGTVNITYMVTPDLTFSTKKDDYLNMPHHIGYDYWLPFDTPQGQWIVFISDFGSAHGEYWEITPKLGSGDVQTFTAEVSRLTPLQDKTITLAFPPGEGDVIILSVSMGDKAN